MVVLLPAVHERGDDVHGDGEDDGTVLLRRYVVQGLQVPQLQEEECYWSKGNPLQPISRGHEGKMLFRVCNPYSCCTSISAEFAGTAAARRITILFIEEG